VIERLSEAQRADIVAALRIAAKSHESAVDSITIFADPKTADGEVGPGPGGARRMLAAAKRFRVLRQDPHAKGKKEMMQASLFVEESRAASRSAAESRRDRGMQRAQAHADAVQLDAWSARAMSALRRYLAEGPGRDGAFLAEQFVDWTKTADVAQPPEPRAWGAVISTAARRGLIRRIGYAPANTSNRSPKCLWQRT
jgi:hypothetical protein